ncbi:hypothetical protein ES708_25200 [subsurface metagenome]
MVLIVDYVQDFIQKVIQYVLVAEGKILRKNILHVDLLLAVWLKMDWKYVQIVMISLVKDLFLRGMDMIHL